MSHSFIKLKQFRTGEQIAVNMNKVTEIHPYKHKGEEGSTIFFDYEVEGDVVYQIVKETEAEILDNL